MLGISERDGTPVVTLVASALQQSFRSWDGLLEWLPIGVYTCDRDGLLVHYNRRAAELWGRSPSPGDPEARFCGAWRAWRPDGTPLPLDEAPMAELLAAGTPIRDREIVIERPDGSRLTILANLDPLLDAEGAIVGGVNCFQDITARKQAEATLQERERRFADLLDALPAAVYTTDAAGCLTFYNQAAIDLWGHRPVLGSDRWCGSWRLFWPDGTPMPHEACPMAVTLKENRPVRDAEAIAERPDGSRVPFIPYPTPLRDATGALVGAVNMLVDISARKKAEETQKLLMSELNHRVKNTLATVQAIARQMLTRTKSPAEFVPSFEGRLQALASAHTLLTRTTWQGADLMTLVREQVLIDGPGDDRTDCEGPEVVLPPQLALHLALVLHELGINARKHGALSVPEGRLAVSWAVERCAAAQILHLSWVETEGPPVSASSARGFGTILIEQSLRPHGGEVRMLSEARGVSWKISLPLPHRSRVERFGRAFDAAQKDGAPMSRDHRHSSEPKAALTDVAGWRVLVVEDEPLLALDIASMLAEAGVAILGPATTVEQALRLSQTAPFDAALLDANLGGQSVDEIAAALTRRNIPFVFATGYGRESLPRAFQSAPVVTKPFRAGELLNAVRRLAVPSDADVVPIRSKALPA